MLWTHPCIPSPPGPGPTDMALPVWAGPEVSSPWGAGLMGRACCSFSSRDPSSLSSCPSLAPPNRDSPQSPPSQLLQRWGPERHRNPLVTSIPVGLAPLLLLPYFYWATCTAWPRSVGRGPEEGRRDCGSRQSTGGCPGKLPYKQEATWPLGLLLGGLNSGPEAVPPLTIQSSSGCLPSGSLTDLISHVGYQVGKGRPWGQGALEHSLGTCTSACPSQPQSQNPAPWPPNSSLCPQHPHGRASRCSFTRRPA